MSGNIGNNFSLQCLGRSFVVNGRGGQTSFCGTPQLRDEVLAILTGFSELFLGQRISLDGWLTFTDVHCSEKVDHLGSSLT